MSNMSMQQMQDLIKRSASIHENSYSREHQQYKTDYYEACFLACQQMQIDIRWAVLIRLLLTDDSWNDILDWATEPRTAVNSLPSIRKMFY